MKWEKQLCLWCGFSVSNKCWETMLIALQSLFVVSAWLRTLHKCFGKMESSMCPAPLVVKNHYSCRRANGPFLKQRIWNIAQIPQSDKQCFWWFEMSCANDNKEGMELSLCPWWKSLFQNCATSSKLINQEQGERRFPSATPVLIQYKNNKKSIWHTRVPFSPLAPGKPWKPWDPCV